MKKLSTTTMSSLEIATLTGKSHDKVMSDIPRILKKSRIDAQAFIGTCQGANGQDISCYNLPRRECKLIARGYPFSGGYKIIMKWQEIEPRIRDKVATVIIAIFLVFITFKGLAIFWANLPPNRPEVQAQRRNEREQYELAEQKDQAAKAQQEAQKKLAKAQQEAQEKLAKESQLKAMQAEIIKALGGKLPKNWQSFEVTENDSHDVSTRFIYKENSAKTLLGVKLESGLVVRLILKILVRQGRKPSEELIFVSNSAWQATTGETGKKRFIPLARARYNPYEDSIDVVFENE